MLIMNWWDLKSYGVHQDLKGRLEIKKTHPCMLLNTKLEMRPPHAGSTAIQEKMKPGGIFSFQKKEGGETT